MTHLPDFVMIGLFVFVAIGLLVARHFWTQAFKNEDESDG